MTHGERARTDSGGKKAVFLDRDNTVIEDPGYLSDPDAVRLLPGVELAMKSLQQAGYALVVVTNQSGVARGLLTEEALERIHSEMRRQLSAHNVHVDGVYYCPYHPEGTVERYALDSELRKPSPGMLLKAAGSLGIDLARSWMVGDSGRDVEAGQRAGCRTVRLRSRGDRALAGKDDENVQPDFTVRNLVDAARLILREDAQGGSAGPAPVRTAPVSLPRAIGPAATAPAAPVEPAPTDEMPKTSVAGAAAIAAQVLAPAALLAALWNLFAGGAAQAATAWALVALTLQAMALTFFITRGPR